METALKFIFLSAVLLFAFCQQSLPMQTLIEIKYGEFNPAVNMKMEYNEERWVITIDGDFSSGYIQVRLPHDAIGWLTLDEFKEIELYDHIEWGFIAIWDPNKYLKKYEYKLTLFH